VSIKFKYTFDQGFKGPILTLHKALQLGFIKGIIQCDTLRVSNRKPTANLVLFSFSLDTYLTLIRTYLGATYGLLMNLLRGLSILGVIWTLMATNKA
jgi:hypothetical protein